MLNLKEVLKTIDDNQVVDICTNSTNKFGEEIKKTLFYGKKKYNTMNNMLDEYFKSEIKGIGVYMDRNPQGRPITVIMIDV